eukprot:3538155-Prymnesium_polylepis.1
MCVSIAVRNGSAVSAAPEVARAQNMCCALAYSRFPCFDSTSVFPYSVFRTPPYSRIPSFAPPPGNTRRGAIPCGGHASNARSGATVESTRSSLGGRKQGII